MKQLQINAGTALILNEQLDALSGYEKININTGELIASRRAYDELLKLGVSVNSGSTTVLEITGEVTHLTSRTIIDSSMSLDGCFVICDGDVIVKDAAGLDGITGLYAKNIFHPESVVLTGVKGLIGKCRAYPSEAVLHLDSMTLGEDSHILLESGLHWVFGNITALDSEVLSRLSDKNVSFICNELTTTKELYEQKRDMLKADKFKFVPDGHSYLREVTLDAATSVIHGEKLYISRDFTIPHDKTQHLSEFSSIVVNGTVTMPVSAAKDFKACGKANDFMLYEGIFRSIDGNETISHEQLQVAIDKGDCYTLEINGKVTFAEDVKPEDIDVIAAVYCNGLIQASDAVRGALGSKIKEMNGKMGSLKPADSETEKGDEEAITSINTGFYRL